MSIIEFRLDVYHHFPPDNTLLRAIANLEQHMSKQDDAINALQTAFDGFKTDISASLDNISADEANILAQLNALDGLSPANQAKVDQIVADMGALATKTKGIADSIPDVPSA